MYDEEEDEFSASSFSAYRKKKAEEDRRERLARSGGVDEDQELRDIIAQSKQVQGDSLQTSRAALAKVRETEQIGAKTLTRLNEQGEQLDKAEKDINRADENMEVSYKAAKDLHKYNNLIPISFKNMFGGRKKKQVDESYEKQMKKIGKEEHKKTQVREKEHGSNAFQWSTAKKKKETPDYLDADAEEEIDQNLDEISYAVHNLKNVSLTMNQELDKQDAQVKRIEATTVHTDHKIVRTEKKISKFL